MPNTKEKLADVQSKLIGLLQRAPYIRCEDVHRQYAVNWLMNNGVTVQEMKPLEAFLHPIDAYKGLKAKYLVFKADTGERVDNCFILRPDKDAAAVEALRAYAKSTDNEILARDIYDWVGKGVTVQDWISVKDRLPENDYGTHWKERPHYLVCLANGLMMVATFGFKEYAWWIDSHSCVLSKEHYKEVTHWMPLPQPPKGE